MAHEYEVISSQKVYTGRVISLRRDHVSMPGSSTGVRDVVEHPGAVAVVAMDAEDRVVLVHQYRHPIRRELAELPAGILDEPDESALDAARRELAEEAGLAAKDWHVLVDLLTSPGMTDEAIRIYLARGLHEVERDVQHHEELEMTSSRVSLVHLVDGVLAGDYENSLLVAGVLAAAQALGAAARPLRAPDAPWPARRP